jgi:glutamate dehydrogenase (NAD(P)+)
MMSVIGPQEDIPAPDMATNEQTMAWMMDTYSMQKGYAVPEVVTGKPISIGGSVFRAEATGAGVVMVTERACQRLGRPLAGQSLRSCRDSGRSARLRPKSWSRMGAKVVGRLGRFRRDVQPGGARPRRGQPSGCWSTRHDMVEYPGGEAVTNEELLELPCDVLVLAALERAAHGPRTRATCKQSLIAEGANGPTTLEADEILVERGIPVLPDVLTNAGGVTVSYFEWCFKTDLGRLFWGRDETRFKLRENDERRLRPRAGACMRSRG